MNKKTSILISVAIISLVSFSAFFLDNGIGVKGMQLGGAYTANPYNSQSIYYNMANLTNYNNSEFYSSYSKGLNEVDTIGVLYHYKLSNDTSIGLGYYRAGVTDVPGADVSGNILASFEFADSAMLVGVSQKLSDESSIGLTVKQVQQQAVENASFIGADVSYKYLIGRYLHLGLNIQDIYTDPQTNDIQPTYKLGMMSKVPGWIFSVDYKYPMLLEKWFYNVGLSYTALPYLTLSAGYNDYDKMIYVGTSFTLFGLNVDYLYYNPDYDATHKVGIGVEL